MPTVPEYSTADVAPSGLSGGQMQGLNPRQLAQGQDASETVKQAGQDILNIGVQNVDAEAREQMMANQVRVDSALNQVRAAQQQLTYDPQSGYLAQKGTAAIQPNDQGQGLTDVYSQKLQSTIDDASSGLANPAQQRVFQNQAQQLQTQFQGQLQSHVLGEYKQFGLNTQQGTIDLAQQSAAKQWNDPDAIGQQIQSAQSAVWKAGQINGDPADLTQAKMQQVTSGIHLQVIDAALQAQNPQYASQYINQYKDQMTAQDLLKASGVVTNDMNSRIATSTAMNAMGAHQQSFAPTDLDRINNITAATESGGNPNAVGPGVPGQGTAKGAMQVMDATAADPGHGIAPEDPSVPGDRDRVGQQLMGALVSKYGGNTAQAWAAYNAGEGTVDKAIAAGGPNWLNAMSQFQSADNHTQTVNYVNKNQQAYENGMGVPERPDRGQIDANIRTQLGPNADPKLLTQALAEGDRLYTDQMSTLKTQGENAVTKAQQYLIQTGGNFAAMPPDMKASITANAPDKWNDLQTFAKSVATPAITDNMAAYHTALENPDELAKMPDSVFNQFAQTNFTDATQKQVATMRQNAIDGKTDAGTGSMNVAAMREELNNRLTSIGINTQPKPTDLDGKEQIGTIQKFITDGIFTQQQQLGRKMNPSEISDFVDTQFAKNSTFKGLIYGTNTSPTLGLKVSDIPSDDVDQVKAALAKQGNTAPSNDQIMRTYWAGKQSNGGQ